MKQCGAKTRSGEPCKNAAMLGASRCRFHGGKTPRGHALPQTRHGRYSKDLPTYLASRFHESQSDPDLLNLRAEIALIDTRLGELVASLNKEPDSAEEEPRSPWPAITELTEQRRKLVETERKRLVDMQQMITAEQAAVLIAALTDAVRRHVHDPDILAAISREFDRITHRTAS